MHTKTDDIINQCELHCTQTREENYLYQRQKWPEKKTPDVDLIQSMSYRSESDDMQTIIIF
jgi:hypothetical protein